MIRTWRSVWLPAVAAVLLSGNFAQAQMGRPGGGRGMQGGAGGQRGPMAGGGRGMQGGFGGPGNQQQMRSAQGGAGQQAIQRMCAGQGGGQMPAAGQGNGPFGVNSQAMFGGNYGNGGGPGQGGLAAANVQAALQMLLAVRNAQMAAAGQQLSQAAQFGRPSGGRPR
jgi:hypothetical protein